MYPYISVAGAASLVNVTLNMCYKNYKYVKFVIKVVFEAKNAPKLVFGGASGMTPLGEFRTLLQTP